MTDIITKEMQDAYWGEWQQTQDHWLALAAALKVRTVVRRQDAELERLRREVEEARADKARLDFLDECNARLNTHHGTTYGWEMVMNHNVNRLMTGHLAVDLNDAKANGFKSCRGAIDEEMKRIEAARILRVKAEETRT